MSNKKKEILQAAETMTANELIEYLQGRGDVELDFENVKTCIEFALGLVSRMKESLEKGEWVEYEINALKALVDETEAEQDEWIEISAYGFGKDIPDNERLLELLGVLDQLDG